MSENIHANPVGTVKKDIYLISNDINSKCYIGQSVDAKQRFASHCKNYTADVSLINRAIKKYGKEHFKMTILEKQIEDYNEREKYWIGYYNTLKPNGYNITPGGEEPPVFYGDDHPNIAISDSDVELLKNDLRTTDISLSDLAKKYNISKKHVMRINSGVSRTVIGESYPIRKTPNINGKLTEEDVDIIIDLLRYTYFFDGEIAREFGVDCHAISRINAGTAHHRDGVHYPIRNWKSCGVALFTYEQVSEIIGLLKDSSISLNRIAKMYNTYVQSIQMINNGSAKKYRREGIEYPIRRFDRPVTTISAKESRGDIGKNPEREAPQQRLRQNIV